MSFLKIPSGFIIFWHVVLILVVLTAATLAALTGVAIILEPFERDYPSPRALLGSILALLGIAIGAWACGLNRRPL